LKTKNIIILSFYFIIKYDIIYIIITINNKNMIYVLKYKLKSEKKEVIIKYYNKDEVLYIIKQINRWLTPIKDSLINWIKTLK
jgi:hypothetical protein